VSAVSEVFEAIAAGDVDRVRALAEHGAERDAQGVSAVRMARYHRRDDMVEALMPPPEALDVWDAAALGRTERLESLVAEDPARVDAVSGDGFRPLALASFFGHEAGVRLLLERGADVRARGTGAIRTTALEAATAADEATIARLLLDAGADPASAQPDGFTPLHAAAANRNRALYDLLLERGADPSAVAGDGTTAAWPET
jgi:ankyrin repeat protein